MREILFKGKPDKNHDFAKLLPSEYAKDWVWGSYIKYEDIHIIVQRDCKPKNIIPNLMVNIKPETICEYTGLTDINGDKIFEGDFLCNYGSRIYCGDYVSEVMFNNGNFIAKNCCAEIEASEFYKFRIIGNKFDNYELVEYLNLSQYEQDKRKNILKDY